MTLWPRKGLAIVGLLAALGLAAAACGGDGEPSAGGTTSGEMTLVMGEFYFSPKVLSIPAGQEVTLTIRNDGKVEHEWMVGKQQMDEGGYQTDLLARMEPTAISGEDYKIEGVGEEMTSDEEGEEHHGAEVDVEPGGSVTIKLNVPADAAGEWEMGCFLAGHYEAGMKGTLNIT